MVRKKTTHDVFSAIGEPKRRALIERLITEELTVTELVDAMSWPQPMVSKQLAILKEVNLVSERKEGRFHFYRIQRKELRPIQEWAHHFEKYWGSTMDQLDGYLNTIQTKVISDEKN